MRIPNHEMFKLNGFTRKGTAYFRVVGDGIIQTVKLRKDGRMIPLLSIGLFSIYNKVPQNYFSSWGCCARFGVSRVVGISESHFFNSIDEEKYFKSEEDFFARAGSASSVFVEKQLEIFQNKGIPWLDNITVHRQLIEGIGYLETNGKNDQLYWNDSIKIEPFIKIGDWQSAARVVAAILEQHQIRTDILSRSFDPDEHSYPWGDGQYTQIIEIYRRWEEKTVESDEDRELMELYKRICDRDENWMQNRMAENYERNCYALRFCKNGALL